MSTMVPMYGFGGGIDNLRFRVYAATSLPASGRENDVCIITSTPIIRWEVFAHAPTWESSNGYVYIQNDPAYSGEYPNVNILKKNAIWLLFGKCWQYENGKWATKNAYQYRNGAWVQFSTTFRATIHITYPAGSVCTATDGTTTLTAPDTSGTWDCVVPNAGTWTVKCTNGSYTANTTVSITSNGQSNSATLEYKLYLYKAGDQCTTVTNGWKANNANMAFSFNSNYIGMNYSGTSDRWANLHTKNKINMAGWSKVNIEAEITSNGQEFWYGVSSNLPESLGSKPSDVLAYGNKGSGGTMTRRVLSLDVSSVNTSAYVCFVAFVISGKIYNVWLS